MIQRQYSGVDKTLKKVLPTLFPELSYSEIFALLRKKDVKVDGVRCCDAERVVSDGANITVYPRAAKRVKVLYEDEHLLACYKPKGIASTGEGSFEDVVSAEKGAVTLLHRLDTNTDGVLLFAKDALTETELIRSMKEGEIEKVYTAEVYGHPRVYTETSLRYYYKKNEEEKRAILSAEPRPGYIPVELTFKVVKEGEESSTLEVRLHRGKMHQIRAMLAHYGYFILGDGKYGDDTVNKRLGIKKHLLTARAVIFRLPKESPLHYLNTLTITI